MARLINSFIKNGGVLLCWILPIWRHFFAQQLMLVGTYDKNGNENFTTVSWVSFTYGEPQCLVMSIHGNISAQQNIEEKKQLSATIVTPELLRFMEICGRAKLKERYYKIAKPPTTIGKLLDVPLIEGAKWFMSVVVSHGKVR
jgi:flavin reductase (DIM6/NTAB) family NADH-FMN oxidoreductase RutF